MCVWGEGWGRVEFGALEEKGRVRVRDGHAKIALRLVRQAAVHDAILI